MNWQYLITGSIILTAVILTGIRLWNFFSKKAPDCNGCSSGCGGCALEDLKKEIEAAKK